MKDLIRYTLVNYFDVFKTEEGWEVNNSCVEADDIYMDINISYKEIAEYLKNAGYLTTSDLRKIFIEDLGEIIEIYQRKDMIPIYSLRMIEA